MYTAPATERKSQNQRAQPGTKPRTPLQERTQSQTNEDSARLAHEHRHGPSNTDIFSATPFPTKPQHILLPSTIRKQRSFRDVENLYAWNQPSVVSRPSTSGQHETGLEELRGGRAPVLQLKRSVSTLRDMYEAQAERSRPSTAASFALRPGTAGSRLRSASSSEGLATRSAWEQLHQVSADDMALLPSLSRTSMEKLASDSSFASRVEQANFLTSTPNYKTFGSSSPKFPVFHDRVASISDEYNQSSSSGAVMTSSSSPNFVRLGRSSSIVDTLNTEQSSSSPNFVKLGTSSPGLRTSSSPSSSALDSTRKRKRTNEEIGRSFAARSRPFSSSPPYAVIGATSSEHSLRSPDSVMPSSPPQPESMHSQSIGNSSPVYRLPGRPRDVSDSSSGSSTHASLQAALTSSPMPPIQYPVIRAPVAAASTLNIPKRVTRNSSTETAGHWPTKLSPVPSEWDEGSIRSASRKSQRVEDLVDDLVRSDSVSPEPTGNESQVCIVSVPDDDHQHEASDELRALPRGLAYRSPPLVPVRTNSLFGTTSSSSNSQSQSRLNSLRTSVDTRLNSMKSFAHSRQNSFISGGRPSSSGSQSTSIIVPTWARRYYSGFYHDSFQYLYPSQTNSASQLSVPAGHNTTRPISMVSLPSHQRASMAVSQDSRRSWRSIRKSLRSSMLEFVPSVLLPKSHQRPEARNSHLTMGVGPLVSNPISPEMVHTRASHQRQSSTIRQIPDQLPAADPRSHWAGITEEQRTVMRDVHSYPYQGSHQIHRLSAEGDSIYYDAVSGQIIGRYRFTDVPHLHHDRRLNTGSSKSRGFGFPFNRKARFQAPSIDDGSDQPTWFQFDLRDAQVTCFILGFICPLVWFIAALLPLPKRPESFDDIEKAVHEQYSEQMGENQDLDIVARLRLERHIKGIEELKWQNARWWKRMNKWMCFVGVVVIVLVIVLAVIGTRNHW